MLSRALSSCTRGCVSRCVAGFRPFTSAASVLPVTHLTADQQLLKESVQKFAESEIMPLVMKMDEEGKLDPSVLQGMFSMGLMGIEVPQDYGGAGMGFTDMLVAVEEIARVDPAVAVILDIHNTLINRAINVFGTHEQKQHYLPKCAQEYPGSFCLSEADSGSDAFSLQCRATKAEGGWSITGAKQWISNSPEAGVFLVFATVDPSLRHRGITCFLVDRGTKGLTIGKKVEKLGIRASSTCEVVLENVFVPDNKVLGEVGLGYKVAIESLNDGRIGIAAQMLGLARGAFEHAVRHVGERRQFGKLLQDYQGVRFQLAELATLIETSRVLIYNAAALKEAGLPYTKEAAMAKLTSARVAEEVASKAVEIFGGYGFSQEYPLEKFYRDAKIGSIYEGTTNMQLETIAKQVLKANDA